DRAVRLHDGIVRRVEPLALVAVGDDGDGTVGFGAGDTPGAVLAGDEPTLAVARVAVRIVGIGAKHADAAVDAVRHPAQHAVVGDVAPDEVVPVIEPAGTLCPAAAVEEQLLLAGAVDEPDEPLVEMFGVR